MTSPAGHDFVVVGGGPVGQHAALKAAVLNHTVLVLDKGMRFSRVSQAPAIANIPGHPGISGKDLLRMHRESLKGFRDLSGKALVTYRTPAEATRLERLDAGREDGCRYRVTYAMRGREHVAYARCVLLATGLVDRKPGVWRFEGQGHATLHPFVHTAGVGYCVLCEGWDMAGKRVAVDGRSKDALSVSRDLMRHFEARVTLLTDGGEPPPGDREGIEVEARPIARFAGGKGDVRVRLEDGQTLRFDKLFFSLGWYKVNNELALMVGARTTEEGYVVTDESGEVLDRSGRRIEGLFAAGDLRADRWKQIVVGWGDAETAVITAYAQRLPD